MKVFAYVENSSNHSHVSCQDDRWYDPTVKQLKKKEKEQIDKHDT